MSRSKADESRTLAKLRTLDANPTRREAMGSTVWHDPIALGGKAEIIRKHDVILGPKRINTVATGKGWNYCIQGRHRTQALRHSPRALLPEARTHPDCHDVIGSPPPSQRLGA